MDVAELEALFEEALTACSAGMDIDIDTDTGVIVVPPATPGAPWSPGTTPTSWVPGSSMHSTSVYGTNQGMNVQTAGTGTTDTDGAGLGAVALTGAGLLAATGLVLRRRFSAQN